MPSIKLENVRISFINALWEPKPVKKVENSAVRYSCRVDFPKGHEYEKLLRAEEEKVVKEAFGTKWERVIKACRADKGSHALRDGDAQKYEDYFGRCYLSLNRPGDSAAPKVFNRDGTPLTATQGVLYPGCFVDVWFDIFLSDKGGTRVCAGLKAVQFRKKGPSLGGEAPFDETEVKVIEEEDADSL